MRLLFAGTPDTAVPALDALIASRHDVVGVLTRPDARAGRGRRLTMSPVKERALEAGIEVLDPAAPRGEDFLADLARLDVDAAPVVAYGAILRPEVLHVPRHGWINLHFSVLPAWRGAAPVQRAIIAGDEITGATTFRIEEGLDTGPVFGTLTETIRPRDTSGVLLERLAVAGAELLVATLDAIEDGTIMAVPQPDDGVSHAPRLQPADARVDWSRPAHIVDRLIRGCTPAPGAWTTLPDGARLGLGPVRVGTPVVRGSASSDGASNGESPPLAPGEIEVRKNAVVVGTGGGVVTLGDVVPPGKRAMPAADWARGARLETGTRLGAA